MKQIQAIDQVYKTGEGYKELNINRTFYWAYTHSQEAGSDQINFDDVIWDDDVKEILDNCERFDISEFTISSNMSGIISTIAAFNENGWGPEGLTRVPSRYSNCFGNGPEMLHAVIIRKK